MSKHIKLSHNFDELIQGQVIQQAEDAVSEVPAQRRWDSLPNNL